MTHDEDDDEHQECDTSRRLLAEGISRLQGALAVLARADVPLAAAYTDFALQICLKEQAAKIS